MIPALVARPEAEGRWRGYRTFLVDGSSFSMPDMPELRARFGQPGGQQPGCGFQVAKILALFHAGAGWYRLVEGGSACRSISRRFVDS